MCSIYLSGDGHVYAPRNVLVAECRKVLDIDIETVLKALGKLTTERRIVVEDIDKHRGGAGQNNRRYYLAHFFACETGLAQRLKFLRTAPKSLRPVRVEDALTWVQRRLAIGMAEKQVSAVRAALTAKVLVITGGPGTGKTTIINAVLQIFARLGVRVLMAAPTGQGGQAHE